MVFALDIAYYYPKAFFSIVPHGNAFTIFHFDILQAVKQFPGGTGKYYYERLHEAKRTQYSNYVYKRLEYLAGSGYVMVNSFGYTITDKGLLLISQVERKLKKLVEESANYEPKPVGRPRKKKD